jgi:hypothetical protein
MWLARKHHEYGCPMCGRRPKSSRALWDFAGTFVTIYRLKCPRKHISTGWFGSPDDASRQWKQLVDEYKSKDAKK